MERNEMIDELKKHVCEVTFTKVTGDKRVLKCTLKEDMLPVSTQTVTSHKTSDEVVAAFDVENNGWRSFRVDSVNNFSVIS